MSKPVREVKVDRFSRQRMHISLHTELCVLLHEEEFGRFRQCVSPTLHSFMGVRTGGRRKLGKRIGGDVARTPSGWRTVLGTLLRGIGASVGTTGLPI